MTRLSVNVNKLATLRNARGGNQPDVRRLSQKILDYGAHGITVHPRPDGRHIRTEDVRTLRALCRERNVEFNVEGYPSREFMQLVDEARPAQATLVPDPPDAITSNAGWNLEKSEDLLREVIGELRGMQVRTSLFIDPKVFSRYQREVLAALKPERIELYTERFAETRGQLDAAAVLETYAEAARYTVGLGIGINAGHDLSQTNLLELLRAIPDLDEVSIGHALICEALEQGLETTIKSYLNILAQV